MEGSHEAQAEVFPRIGNNSDHGFHPFFGAQIHEFPHFWSTLLVHLFQVAQVRQQAEARCDVSQQNSTLLQAAPHLLNIHPLGKLTVSSCFDLSASTRTMRPVSHRLEIHRINSGSLFYDQGPDAAGARIRGRVEAGKEQKAGAAVPNFLEGDCRRLRI
jgi:hypothetical protein